MWSSLKQLIKSNRDKCVVIEDGEPKYVILPFAEYQHLQSAKAGAMLKENSANKEWQEAAESENDYTSSVNIEDLPF